MMPFLVEAKRRSFDLPQSQIWEDGAFFSSFPQKLAIRKAPKVVEYLTSQRKWLSRQSFGFFTLVWKFRRVIPVVSVATGVHTKQKLFFPPQHWAFAVVWTNFDEVFSYDQRSRGAHPGESVEKVFWEGKLTCVWSAVSECTKKELILK